MYSDDRSCDLDLFNSQILRFTYLVFLAYFHVVDFEPYQSDVYCRSSYNKGVWKRLKCETQDKSYIGNTVSSEHSWIQGNPVFVEHVPVPVILLYNQDGIHRGDKEERRCQGEIHQDLSFHHYGDQSEQAVRTH